MVVSASHGGAAAAAAPTASFVRQAHRQDPSLLSLELQNFTGTLRLQRLPPSSSSAASSQQEDEHDRQIRQNTNDDPTGDDGDQKALSVDNKSGSPWDEELGAATVTGEQVQGPMERGQTNNSNSIYPSLWMTPAQSPSSWASENNNADDDDCDDDHISNQRTDQSSSTGKWSLLSNPLGSLITKRQSPPAKTKESSSSDSAIVAVAAASASSASSSTRGARSMPTVVHAVRAARRLQNGSGVGAAAAATTTAATSGSSLAPLPPPTRLHQLLSSGSGNSKSATTILSDLEHFVIRPKDAATPDTDGRLPLHLLGDNDELISSSITAAWDTAGREEDVLSVFGVRLMQAYPEAITALDAGGHMPFVRLVEDWVNWVQEMKRQRQTKRRRKDVLTGILFHHGGSKTSEPQSNSSSMAAAAAVSRGSGRGHPSVDSSDADGVSVFSQAAIDTLASGITVNLESSGVELWEEVEWCFTMLSKEIDVLRECDSAPGAHHLEEDGVSDDLDPTQDMQHEPRLRGEQACEQLLVHLLTRIPNLLKTVLALDKDSISRLLSTTVMKRVLLRTESVGAWLTKIMQSGLPSSSARGVDYLVAVSKLTAQDRYGSGRVLSSEDQLTFTREKERLFDAICDLNGMVGSLVVLEEDSLEKALRTKIVWHIVSTKLSRPFVVSLVLIDLILHLTLMQVSHSACVTIINLMNELVCFHHY